MKRSSKKAQGPAMAVLEYVGESGRLFRDLGVLQAGQTVTVTNEAVASLLATGFFKPAGKADQEKEGER